jgi:hypothetical protein
MTLKPHNIGTHLKGIETSFQVEQLFLKSFNFWELYHFLKFSQNTFIKGLMPETVFEQLGPGHSIYVQVLSVSSVRTENQEVKSQYIVYSPE